jgi:hypothetical protein
LVTVSSEPIPVKGAITQTICLECGLPYKWDSEGNITEGCDHIKQRAAEAQRILDSYMEHHYGPKKEGGE